MNKQKMKDKLLRWMDDQIASTKRGRYGIYGVTNLSVYTDDIIHIGLQALLTVHEITDLPITVGDIIKDDTSGYIEAYILYKKFKFIGLCDVDKAKHLLTDM